MGAERGGLEVVCLVIIQGTAKNSQGLDLTGARMLWVWSHGNWSKDRDPECF